MRFVTIRTDVRPFISGEFYDAQSTCHFLWTFCDNQDRRTAFLQCDSADAHSECYCVDESSFKFKIIAMCLFEIFFSPFFCSGVPVRTIKFKFSQFSDCWSNASFLPSLKMIDSICHTHTTWTSLYPSFSSKILHFRCMMPMNQISRSHPCSYPHDHPYQRWHCLSYCDYWEQRTPHLCEFYDADSNGYFVWISCHNQDRRNGFSPVWILRCTFKLPQLLNVLSHSGHTNGFSPVWTLRCTFQVFILFKLLSTISTDKRRFTSVNSTMSFQLTTMFECLVTIRDRRKAFHQCGLCDAHSKYAPRLNFLSQSGQANGFSPLCFPRCLFKSLLYLNVLSQSGQANGLQSWDILSRPNNVRRWCNSKSRIK